MKINNLFILLLLGIVAIPITIGCVHHRLPDHSMRRQLGKNIPALAYDHKSVRNTIEEPAGTLTLLNALELALLKNPELSVYSLEIRAREAKALQVSLRSNPELDVEMDNISDFGKNESTLSIGQLIELGGKINKRARMAELESDLAAWDYEAKRLEIFTETAKAFRTVISAQERVKLHKDMVSLSEKFIDSVNRRIKAGKVSAAESSRAQVELSISRIELERSRNELNASRHRLSAIWGSMEPKFVKAEGTLGILPSLPSFSKLKSLLDQNLDIGRWPAEIEQRKVNLELQKAGRIPDPTIKGGFSRSNDTRENSFQLGVSIPIPFFNLNDGAIEEAEIRLEQGNKQRHLVSLKIFNLLKESYSLLSSAHQEVVTLKTRTLPEAENAYKLIDEYYLLGRYSFIDVLYARRTLFEVKARHLTALRDYNQYISDIERLIGQRLDKVK